MLWILSSLRWMGQVSLYVKCINWNKLDMHLFSVSLLCKFHNKIEQMSSKWCQLPLVIVFIQLPAGNRAADSILFLPTWWCLQQDPQFILSVQLLCLCAHTCVRPTAQCVESAESINISQSLSLKKLNCFFFFICVQIHFFSEVSQVVSHRNSCAGLEDNKTQVHVFWVIMYEYEYIFFYLCWYIPPNVAHWTRENTNVCFIELTGLLSLSAGFIYYKCCFYLSSHQRHHSAKEGLRGGRPGLPLRHVQGADGERHPRAQVHRGRAVQRQLVWNQCPVGKICGWKGETLHHTVYIKTCILLIQDCAIKFNLNLGVLMCLRANTAFWMCLEMPLNVSK